MSSDMFSSMVEKNVEQTKASYVDMEIEKWKQYAKDCSLNQNKKCKITQYTCSFHECHDWRLINYIKFGIL